MTFCTNYTDFDGDKLLYNKMAAAGGGRKPNPDRQQYMAESELALLSIISKSNNYNFYSISVMVIGEEELIIIPILDTGSSGRHSRECLKTHFDNLAFMAASLENIRGNHCFCVLYFRVKTALCISVRDF